jgi:hypothetical protein
MEHFREIKNNLTWHNEGKFEVELINGVIKKLNFCEPGKGPDDTGKALTSTNFKYLQSVHSCLGELFAFIEEENKRLGYKYALGFEIPGNQSMNTENVSPATETKLRPLINYNHEPDTERLSAGNEDLHSGQANIELTA